MRKLAAFDYETDPIDNRPNYPPKPVGLAILIEDSEPVYIAWGHPTENNTTFKEARPYIKEFFEHDFEFIAHNLAFDAAVTEEKMDIKFPWQQAHDTMLLAFLLDPFGELSLKPLAEQYLGEKPTEQDDVRDWLVKHGVARANDKQWGAHIGKAPGGLVGTYAKGDVRKTMNLFKLFWAKLEAKGTQNA